MKKNLAFILWLFIAPSLFAQDAVKKKVLKKKVGTVQVEESIDDSKSQDPTPMPKEPQILWFRSFSLGGASTSNLNNDYGMNDFGLAWGVRPSPYFSMDFSVNYAIYAFIRLRTHSQTKDGEEVFIRGAAYASDYAFGANGLYPMFNGLITPFVRAMIGVGSAAGPNAFTVFSGTASTGGGLRFRFSQKAELELSHITRVYGSKNDFGHPIVHALRLSLLVN